MVGRPSKKIECGAYARSTGEPCKAKALPNGKCKLHGGLSTGAKTPEGRLKSLMNLKNVGRRIEKSERYRNKILSGTSNQRKEHQQFMYQIKYHSHELNRLNKLEDKEKETYA
jgi:hypothetical protein